MELAYNNRDAVCAPGGMSRPHMPTLEERLLQRKSSLEADLKDINEALGALQANPEIMKVVNLITKVNY